MRYPLYDLSWQEFENIVISICEEILGTGTIKFADGKDGGRDAKFTGTANNFPSNAQVLGKASLLYKLNIQPTC